MFKYVRFGRSSAASVALWRLGVRLRIRRRFRRRFRRFRRRSFLKLTGPVRPREAELQDEVRQLKAMVRELSNKVDQLSAGGRAGPPRVRLASGAWTAWPTI